MRLPTKSNVSYYFFSHQGRVSFDKNERRGIVLIQQFQSKSNFLFPLLDLLPLFVVDNCHCDWQSLAIRESNHAATEPVECSVACVQATVPSDTRLLIELLSFGRAA